MVTAFDQLDVRALRAVAYAQEEAVRFGHDYIGVEHLLLGLVRDGDSAGGRALTSLGLELSALRSFIGGTAARSTRISDEVALTQQGRRALEVACDEARSLGATVVGTEHVALAIAGQREGLAHAALLAADITLERIRDQLNTARR